MHDAITEKLIMPINLDGKPSWVADHVKKRLDQTMDSQKVDLKEMDRMNRQFYYLNR
jgi:hypothetical protein